MTEKRLELVRGLGAWASGAIVVGTMIGTGIFLKPAEMAREGRTVSIVLPHGSLAPFSRSSALCHLRNWARPSPRRAASTPTSDAPSVPLGDFFSAGCIPSLAALALSPPSPPA